MSKIQINQGLGKNAQITIKQTAKLKFDVLGYTSTFSQPSSEPEKLGQFRTLEKALLFAMKHSNNELSQVSFVALNGEIINFQINNTVSAQ